MRCQTKDRGRWNFDAAEGRGREGARGGERASDAAEISEGSGSGAHGRYDLIMIRQGTISGPTARTFTVGGVRMSDISPVMILSPIVAALPSVLFRPSC